MSAAQVISEASFLAELLVTVLIQAHQRWCPMSTEEMRWYSRLCLYVNFLPQPCSRQVKGRAWTGRLERKTQQCTWHIDTPTSPSHGPLNADGFGRELLVTALLQAIEIGFFDIFQVHNTYYVLNAKSRNRDLMDSAESRFLRFS